MRPLRAARPLCAPLLAWLCTSALAQPPASTGPKAATFDAEPYLVTSASTVVSMNADGTGTRVLTMAAVLRSEAAIRQSGVVSVAFPSHSEHVDFVYVRVVHSDGSKEETPVASAIEQPAPVTQQAPLYSDLTIKQIPVRSLRVGDTLEWQARFTVDHPEIPNQSWGQDTFIKDVVTLDETYELRVPSSLHLSVWTNPGAGTDFTESASAGTHIYRWHHATLRPTIGPEADAFRKSEATRIHTLDEELDETKGALPSFAWSTFPDWASVGAWYRSLSADRSTPDAAIKAKVAELTAGKTTELDRAQAVYTYVSSQIRYIGVDFGIGRYQPHTAAEVFANRYGDCKDKHTLLAAMLSVLNLRADPVLVGAGIRFNPAVPSPAAFNHLITRLSLDGKDVWLDSTAEVGAWGSLLYPIRDQQALVVPAAGPAVIAQTPADLPFAQYSNATVVGSYDTDLTSDSTFTFTFHSDTELYLRAILHSVSPAAYSQFVQQFMAGLGFGGTTSDPVIDHLDDPSQPLTISFHYHRVKEKDWGENRVTAAFMPTGLPAFAEQNPPTSSIQLGPLRTETSTIEMKLPKDWNVQLPEAIHAHTPFANIDVTYRFTGGKLFADRRLTIRQSKVAVSDAKSYLSWYETSDAASVPYIQLLPPPKIGNAATAAQQKELGMSAAMKGAMLNPHAAELVREAYNNMAAVDLDAARTHLDQAAKLSPTEKLLWAGYSNIAYELGRQNEAIEDLKREVTYHPDEVRLYASLSRLQLSQRDAEASVATLRAWMKAAPRDPAPYLALARQLESSNHHADAIKEVQSAVAALAPTKADTSALRVVEADAQVSLGRPAEAAATVAPLLRDATEPAVVNNIDLILANAGLDLPDAVAAQTRILASAENETTSLKASEDIRLVVPKQALLLREWDTMAWLLYAQQKYAEAFAYDQPARLSSSSSEVAGHFAKIVAALKDASKTGVFHQSDQEIRTFPLGSANGRNGSAGSILLLAGGRVLDFIRHDSQNGTQPTLSDADDLLKMAELGALFPPNSTARLLCPASIRCDGETCGLYLYPLPRESS